MNYKLRYSLFLVSFFLFEKYNRQVQISERSLDKIFWSLIEWSFQALLYPAYEFYSVQLSVYTLLCQHTLTTSHVNSFQEHEANSVMS